MISNCWPTRDIWSVSTCHDLELAKHHAPDGRLGPNLRGRTQTDGHQSATFCGFLQDPKACLPFSLVPWAFMILYHSHLSEQGMLEVSETASAQTVAAIASVLTMWGPNWISVWAFPCERNLHWLVSFRAVFPCCVQLPGSILNFRLGSVSSIWGWLPRPYLPTPFPILRNVNMSAQESAFGAQSVRLGLFFLACRVPEGSCKFLSPAAVALHSPVRGRASETDREVTRSCLPLERVWSQEVSVGAAQLSEETLFMWTLTRAKGVWHSAIHMYVCMYVCMYVYIYIPAS